MEVLRGLRLGGGGLTRGRVLAGLLLAAALLGAAGCEGDPDEAPPDPYRDIRERLSLSDDQEIHRITLGGRDGREHVVPTTLSVPRGAVVVFLAVDGRVHTIHFPEDSLPLDGALFLERTNQSESPPLMSRGSRFVITLEGAPVGRYVFESRGPGGEARGSIVVGETP